MRHVVFCHGKDSSPRAQKIQWLMPMARDAGLSVSAQYQITKRKSNAGKKNKN